MDNDLCKTHKLPTEEEIASAKKCRVFRGDETGQLRFDGKPADPERWYYEPVDYDGDVLWSRGYESRADAEWACGLRVIG